MNAIMIELCRDLVVHEAGLHSDLETNELTLLHVLLWSAYAEPNDSLHSYWLTCCLKIDS